MLPALLLRPTLLPSYPRTHPAAISSSRRSFHFRRILAPAFFLVLYHYFAGILILRPNPTILCRTSTLAGSFFLSAVLYICLLRSCLATR